MIVSLTIENNIAYLTINRPEKRNAINLEVCEKITQYCTELNENQSVKTLVIKGEQGFSSGADLSWFKAIREQSMPADTLTSFVDMLTTLSSLTMPTMAVVDGHCMGGAMGIIACCDVVIAHKETIFSLPELSHGIAPYMITEHLMNKIPLRVIKDWMLKGTPIDPVSLSMHGVVQAWFDQKTKADITHDWTLRLSSYSKAYGCFKTWLMEDRATRPIDQIMTCLHDD